MPVSLKKEGFVLDYNITIKYDLLDFIKKTITLNYDNQPAVIGAELDYISSGFL
jgi:hypothetical protein